MGDSKHSDVTFINIIILVEKEGGKERERKREREREKANERTKVKNRERDMRQRLIDRKTETEKK